MPTNQYYKGHVTQRGRSVIDSGKPRTLALAEGERHRASIVVSAPCREDASNIAAVRKRGNVTSTPGYSRNACPHRILQWLSWRARSFVLDIQRDGLWPSIDVRGGVRVEKVAIHRDIRGPRD